MIGGLGKKRLQAAVSDIVSLVMGDLLGRSGCNPNPTENDHRRAVLRLSYALRLHSARANVGITPRRGHYHNLSLLMRQLIGAGTPREAVAGGYGGIFPHAHRGMLVALGVSQSGQTVFAAAFLIWE